MVFINRSKSSPKKQSYSISLCLPQEYNIGNLLLSPTPGGYSLTLISGALLMCFSPPGIFLFLTIPLLNSPPSSDLGFNPPSPFSLHWSLQTSLISCFSDWQHLTGEMETRSKSCAHLGCYVEKDSETETMSRISKKRIRVSDMGCKK